MSAWDDFKSNNEWVQQELEREFRIKRCGEVATPGLDAFANEAWQWADYERLLERQRKLADLDQDRELVAPGGNWNFTNRWLKGER